MIFVTLLITDASHFPHKKTGALKTSELLVASSSKNFIS